MRLYRASPGRDENPRPGFDHWRSQWDSLRASRADCPKGEARRAESIPPSPPYSKKKPELTLRLFCVYIAPAQGGMRTLDQGSTGGLPPGRQDRLRACRPKGEAHRAESIPPSPPYLKKEPELTLRLFCVYIAPAQGGMRTLDLGSTGGLPPGRQDRLRACSPKGEDHRAESIPPSPPSLKKEPVRKYGLFAFICRDRDGRCASLACPTHIRRNGVVGWVSVSAPTVYHASPPFIAQTGRQVRFAYLPYAHQAQRSS